MGIRSRVNDALEAPRQIKQSVAVSIALSVLAILIGIMAMVVHHAN